MMTNYFMAIPFDIFNLSLVGCGIVCGVALLLTVLFLALKCSVTYYDVDGGKEVIYKEKHSWCSRVKIHSANKKGKRLIGWSKKSDGRSPLLKHKIVLFKNVKLYAIWEETPDMVPASMVPKPVEKEPEKEFDYSEGVIVKFNFIDTQSEETIAVQSFKINGRVPNEDGVLGWCFNPGGDITLQNGTENYVFDVNLYPVTALLDDDKTVISNEEFSGECVVDLAYIITSTEKTVYKESHYLKLALPKDFDGEEKFIGWSNEPDGDVVIERGEIDTIFTLKFFSYEEAVEEAEPVAEEIAEEPVIEEPVIEEPVIEEPVIEEPVIEEPVIEEIVAEEKPAPLYEEIIEEYIPPVVEEPVAKEEPVIEQEVEDEIDYGEIEYIEPSDSERVYEEFVAQPVCEAPEDDYEEIEEEPVIEEPVIEEPVVEEPVAEEPVVEEEPENELGATIVPTYFDNEGNKIDIKYSRSVTANIIQSDDKVKNYYSELKNHILSYKGVKSRISWKFDSYNRGRDQLFKIKLRGKTICMYCALDPNEFEESKYHHEAIDAKIFADVPMLVKIKSDLGLRKAKELVDIVMAKFNIEKDPKAKEVDYVAKYPYEPNEPLLARKLIKILEADDNNVVKSTKPKEEEIVPVIEEPVIEEPVIEEPVIEEPVIEEPVIEEPVVEEEPEIIVESVSAEEAHAIVEEKQVEVVVEEDVDYITKNDNKKAIINIDTLSKAYNAGEVVDMKSMKEKKLIDKKAKSVKVLARGVLDKPLKVKAGDFSVTAVEMILLTGGHAMHVTYKIK